MPNSNHKRWLRYSLRTFLIVLTLACLWLGRVVQKAAKQREAVEWITEKSGRAWYDFQVDNAKGLPVDLRAEPPGPDWLRDRIGLDYFANLRWVEVNGATDLSRLATLHDLRELHVDHSYVSDLSAVKNLTNLKRLFVRHSPIRDITPLAELDNLDHLSLNDTDIRDVTPLFQLHNLKSLNLHRTLVAEEDLAELKRALPECGIVWSRRE